MCQHMCKARQLASMWMYWRSHIEGRPCLCHIPLNVCRAWYLPCTKCGCLRGFFPHVWRLFETKCGAGCCTLRGVVGGDGRKCGCPPTWTEGQCHWLIGCLHLHWQGGHGPHLLRQGQSCCLCLLQSCLLLEVARPDLAIDRDVQV